MFGVRSPHHDVSVANVTGSRVASLTCWLNLMPFQRGLLANVLYLRGCALDCSVLTTIPGLAVILVS